MRFRNIVAGLLAGAIVPCVLSTSASADHKRHWFFGQYNQYERDTFGYYVPPRRYDRRRPVVVYEDPYEDGDDIYWEEELEEELAARRRHRWRDRRVRYDLSRDRKHLQSESWESRPPRFVNVPLPRRKPASAQAFETATLSEPDQITSRALAEPQVPELPREVRAPVAQERSAKSAEPRKAPISRSAGAVSCDQAKEIVAGFGFSDIEAKSCSGKNYDFAAKRDGKPFTIRLSAASGELTEVKRN